MAFITASENQVDAVAQMGWGSHLCLFYETKQELLDLVVPYLTEGIEANEFCLWAKPDSVTPWQAKTAFDAVTAKYDHVTLQILSAPEFYGTGDFQRIANFWDKLLSAALANGFKGLRACGDMSWLGASDWEQFCIYEMGVNGGIAGKKKALCTYPLSAACSGDIADVAVAHKCTLAKQKRDWTAIEPLTLAATNASDAARRVASLSNRERQILDGLMSGRNKRALSSSLGIAVRTVESHRTRMLDRLNVATFAEAVRMGALAKAASSSTAS
jgi:DNA-binding CsgD family transcriptional regulator